MAAWGGSNIKSIKYAHIEDMINNVSLASKTKSNTLAALKQFWGWAHVRHEIPPIKKRPKISNPEMAFRKTVSIAGQEIILAEMCRITAPIRIRSWIGIKRFCTYISIRPAEMLSLTEGNVDRRRGLLIVPHPRNGGLKLFLYWMKTGSYWQRSHLSFLICRFFAMRIMREHDTPVKKRAK